jgi:predicted ester cyclase
LDEKSDSGKAAALTVIGELYAIDFVYPSSTCREIHGIKDFKQYVSEFYSAFPDVHFTIEDMIVEGDKAVVHLTGTGTNKGAFKGITPTNKNAKL